MAFLSQLGTGHPGLLLVSHSNSSPSVWRFRGDFLHERDSNACDCLSDRSLYVLYVLPVCCAVFVACQPSAISQHHSALCLRAFILTCIYTLECPQHSKFIQLDSISLKYILLVRILILLIPSTQFLNLFCSLVSFFIFGARSSSAAHLQSSFPLDSAWVRTYAPRWQTQSRNPTANPTTDSSSNSPKKSSFNSSS